MRRGRGSCGSAARQILVISTAGEVGSEFEEERTRLRQEATDGWSVDRVFHEGGDVVQWDVRCR
jgi:hypothetical protein